MSAPRVVWVAVASALTSTLGAACRDVAPPAAPATLTSPVVYGADDRTEWYAVADDATRELMRSAIAAMVRNEDLIAQGDGSFALASYQTLGEANGMCADQRFFDQPTAAVCSGTLIDDRLLLTAAHCVQSLADCASYAWVFDYRYQAEGALAPLDADAIYHCVDIITNGFDDLGDAYDFAILELDRPVTGRTPARVRSPGPIGDGEGLTLIGFPNGIPMKLARDGVVIDGRAPEDTYFIGAVDAFYGNSGSGVFDDEMAVAGILVTGADDYVDVGTCTIVQVLEPAAGEEVMTYASRAVAELCQKRYPSEALCGGAFRASCGDGWCTDGELPDTCPDDCDGLFAVPAAWTCNRGFYAAVDGCDCDCGTFDPDCADQTADVFNCAPASRCGSDGLCEEPIPATWVCPRDYYAASDGCDCACGAYDPDCATPTRVVGCVRGTACLPDGTCEAPIAPGWSCSDRWYAARDGCDCDCGAFDPDCAEPSQEVGGCVPGSACRGDGTCEQSIPEAWICRATLYGAGDACDCNCGARDPDCDDPRSRIVNCSENQVCSESGACMAPTVMPEPEPEPVTESADEFTPTDESDPEPAPSEDARGVVETDAGATDGDREPVRVYASGGGCAAGHGGPGGLLAAIAGCFGAAMRRRDRPAHHGRLPAGGCAIHRAPSRHPSGAPTNLAPARRGAGVAQGPNRPRLRDRRRRKLNAHANVTSHFR